MANEAELVGLTTSGDIKPIVATMDPGCAPGCLLFASFCALVKLIAGRSLRVTLAFAVPPIAEICSRCHSFNLHPDAIPTQHPLRAFHLPRIPPPPAQPRTPSSRYQRIYSRARREITETTFCNERVYRAYLQRYNTVLTDLIRPHLPTDAGARPNEILGRWRARARPAIKEEARFLAVV